MFYLQYQKNDTYIHLVQKQMFFPIHIIVLRYFYFFFVISAEHNNIGVRK